MSNMVVNTNVLALNSHRNLGKVGNAQTTASQRLSSGMKINSAADDSAGLAISEKMRGQIRGLDMASKNGQDGISLIQTAEGGMQEITNMVQRMRELTVQAANDTNTNEDRIKIADETDQLSAEITSMAQRVEFNKKTVLSGKFGNTAITSDGAPDDGTAGDIGSIIFQIGANNTQNIRFGINEMTATSLSLDAEKIGDVIRLAEADAGHSSVISAVISVVENALQVVNNERAKLGAVQNRIEYTVKSLNISSENLSAAESRIRDSDMAKEMMNMTKANVLQQAATSMLSQANQAPQGVLKLLQ